MTIAGSLKQEEWVLNETFFFLLPLLFPPSLAPFFLLLRNIHKISTVDTTNF